MVSMAEKKHPHTQKQTPHRKFPLKPAILLVVVLVVVAAAIIIIGRGKAPAQPASWYQTYGETADETGNIVRQTGDGGYIISGQTISFGAGGNDIWLIKTDDKGQLVWNKAYGGEGEESGLALAVLPDGYLAAGYTTSFGSGGQDAWLLRIDSEGDLLWEKTFGGAGNDAVSSIIPAPGGGFVLAGFTFSSGSGNSDGWLFKVDDSGSQVWSWTYGGTELDYLRGVNTGTDGSFIAIGSTDSFGSQGDIWLVKTDAQGNTLWQKRYRGQGNDFPVYAAETSDSGYMIAGTGSSGEGSSDYWLIRTDSAGVTTWSRTYGGSQDDVLEDARTAPDGSIVLIGRTYTSDSTTNVWLMRINAAGDKTWEEMVGGSGDDTGLSVLDTADGYVFTGSTSSYGAGLNDVWLVKVIPG
jgi:hypothetical protein